jgi:hypothetical protein
MRDSPALSPAAHSTALTAPAAHAVATEAAPYWILRVGAALCFIGHGAFGFITKAAWVPYFGLVGISESWAYTLMPLIGAVDVTVGMAVLFAPRRVALGYMALWAVWTALLRPFSGDSVFEAVERAGNYGVPFALLLYSGFPRTSGDWLGRVTALPPSRAQLDLVKRALHVTTVMLLAGHGALGAITGKAVLAKHFAALGMTGSIAPVLGWGELALAACIAVRPSVALLVVAAAWKLASESLFLVAGDPVWELVERAGSYAAPFALALLLMQSGQGDRSRRLL